MFEASSRMSSSYGTIHATMNDSEALKSLFGFASLEAVLRFHVPFPQTSQNKIYQMGRTCMQARPSRAIKARPGLR